MSNINDAIFDCKLINHVSFIRVSIFEPQELVCSK